MATTVPRKGLTLPAIAALGLAIFGAYKYKQSLKTGGDKAPHADDIDVGTTPAS